jgi:uncharacterized protein (DUF58 family)
VALADLRHRLEERAARWSRRRQGPDVVPLTLARRRLYVLPTRAGIGFGFLLFFMMVAGLNYANSLALFFTFLFAGFAIVAMYRCHRNLLGVAVIAANARPAFAGESVGLRLTLANDARLPRAALEVGVPGEPRRRCDLPPGARATLEIEVPAPHRGLMRIDRVLVTTTFPFGLFRSWTWLHMPIDAVVYPKPRGKRPPPAAPGRRTGLRSHAGIGDDEWLGLRNFRDGDSPRRVAWKALAQGGALMVKEYGASADDLRWFDLSDLPGLDLEARLEQLSRWIVDAEARGDRYALELDEHPIAEPARGPQHRHRCLAALALHGFQGVSYAEA